jgi:hypothetical protein
MIEAAGLARPRAARRPLLNPRDRMLSQKALLAVSNRSYVIYGLMALATPEHPAKFAKSNRFRVVVGCEMPDRQEAHPASVLVILCASLAASSIVLAAHTGRGRCID